MDELEKRDLVVVERMIGIHKDFPKKGVVYRDIMPLLAEPKIYSRLMDIMYSMVQTIEFDRVLGIESRGFLIGPMLAERAGKPFVPVRKKGKLPGEVLSVEYDLEYGKDTLQVQKNTMPRFSKCLIVDDLIATGGSMCAAKKLVELGGGYIAGFAAIILLESLGGRSKLGPHPVLRLFSY